MPTVPTEQNRVGIAGVTDTKLQPGDYSNTGLQALGAGMQQLAETGQKIAPVLQRRQDSDDDFEIKKAWNAYAEGARSIRADAMGKFDADPKGALAQVTQDYGGLRDWIRSGLKNDRQRDLFDRVIAERFDYDLSGALTESEKALRRGEDAQGLLLEQNAADDAIGNAGDPALFDKYLHTGAESIARRAAARGDDPTAIEQGVTAYRSGIQRRVLQDMIGADPVAAANRYRAMRDGMTPADRQAAERELLEPLARTLGVRDVDALLPSPETEGPAPLSPEQRASLAEAIETQPWTEVRKRYAREDLATRGGLADRQRQRAADDARDEGLAIIERLGGDFTSITQLPPEVRRDLDDDTAQTLGLMAQDNLDGRPVAPNGVTSLMMNLIASQNPAAFAKEDLRLVRGKVTPEEYETFVRLQQGVGKDPGAGGAATLGRAIQKISWQVPAEGAPVADGAIEDSYPSKTGIPASHTQTESLAAPGLPTSGPEQGTPKKPAAPDLARSKPGPANILADSPVGDRALAGLIERARQYDLRRLETEYRKRASALSKAEEKLIKAKDENKGPKKIAQLQQKVELRRQAAAQAAAGAILPATQASRDLQQFFVGRNVNIIQGNPADKRGNVAFDRAGRVRFPRGSTPSTYTIKGPDYKFENPDDAAYDAIALARAVAGALDDRDEKMGYIVKRPDGSFGYEYPRALVGQTALSKLYAQGTELETHGDPTPRNAVAIWHIHPVGGSGDNVKNIYFGPGDIEASTKAAKAIEATKFDAYLGGSDGGVRVVRGMLRYSSTKDGTTLDGSAYNLVGPGYLRLR